MVKKPPKAQREFVSINRRRIVASYYMMKMTQDEIVETLKTKGIEINQSTVCRDIKRIKEEWKAECHQELDDIINRELMGIDKLELEAYAMYNRHKKSKDTANCLKVVDTILKLGERRSKLIGLDKPDKIKIEAEHKGAIAINLIRASCKEPVPEELLDKVRKTD